MAGWEAFYSCKNLSDVTLGSKLRVIGNASFAGTKITSIHIPDSVEQINFGAFGDIRSLKSVTGCKGLKKYIDWHLDMQVLQIFHLAII